MTAEIITKVLTWNVNSVNARIEHLEKVIKSLSPDILLLQELKCTSQKFPYEILDGYGYNIAMLGQKSYNGVAILSKAPIENIKYTFIDLPDKYNYFETDENNNRGCNSYGKIVPENQSSISEYEFGLLKTFNEARYIEGYTFINGLPLKVASVYVPNGAELKSDKFQYKLSFLKELYKYLEKQTFVMQKNGEMFIIGGDFNVAPEEIDVFDPKSLEGEVSFHIEERKLIRSILNSGWNDSFRTIHPDKVEFSWWDYRRGGFAQNKGMRIDYLMLSAQSTDRLKSSYIYTDTRSWEKPSDHVPVLCELTAL